ncbi:hypothetical protein BDZ45DRAFT_748724 [Acephala macrosclerotiorum]|nr:hypothetical protein BDZ45DRAFT_748724 [Acephala macrosclerotiorum]
MEISGITLLDNLDESTKARYQLALDKQLPLVPKCPNCSESFSDLRLLLRHHQRSHLISESSPHENGTTSEKEHPAEQVSDDKDADSDTSRHSTSSQTSEESSVSTTITEPDLDEETSPTRASTPTTPSPTPKRVHRERKIYHLPSITVLLGKTAIHFLGLQTTAWFVLVLAALATSITTSYSMQGPAPNPPAEIGDSSYYSLLSQSIITICSLYYLMVPYFRGDEEHPVRALFYICWILSLLGAIAAPLTYAKEWTKSVWYGFGSALAKVAATAFLFERAKRHDQNRSQKTAFKIVSESEPQGKEGLEKVY